MGLHGGTAESTLHTCILKAKVLKLIRSLFLRCLQKHDVIHSQGALSKDRVTVSIWAQRNSGRFAHQSLTDIKKGPLFKKKHSFSFSWRRSGPAVFCGSPHLFHLHLQPRPFLTHQPILYLRAEISYVCSPLERKLFGEVGVGTVRPNPHLSPMMRLNPHPHPAHMGWRNLERGCRCSSASHAAHTAL